LFHDPVRAATLLRDIFANERARIGFFIGAGCPVSVRCDDEEGATRPLIPDIKGLTSKVREQISEKYSNELNIIDGISVELGRPTNNIEHTLSIIRSHIEIVGSGTIRGLDHQMLQNIDQAICSYIRMITSVKLPDADSGYRAIAQWIEGLERTNPVEIFTTNYDLLLEQALETNRLTYFDGFTGADRPFFNLSAIERDSLPAFWTRLWKLHGSINWSENQDGNTVHRYTLENESKSLPISSHGSLIYPSHRKYDQSRRLPYLALIDRLKIFLRKQSSVLVVSGYSFGDAHLNEVIIDSLESNPTALCFSLAFGNMNDHKILRQYAERRSNLTVFAYDSGVIGRKFGKWCTNDQQNLDSLRNIFERRSPDDTSDSSESEQSNDEATAKEPLTTPPNSAHYGCRIADFKSLGEFLIDVSGSFNQVERAARA